MFSPSLLAAAVVAASAHAGRTPVAAPLDPRPPAVAELIRGLGDRRAVVREAAERRLTDLPAALPFLAAALETVPPDVRPGLARAVRALEKAAAERCKARAEFWATARRIDLLVDHVTAAASLDPGSVDLAPLGDLFRPMMIRGAKSFDTSAMFLHWGIARFTSYDDWFRHRKPVVHVGANIILDRTAHPPHLVCALTCDVKQPGLDLEFCVVRDSLRAAASAGRGQWSQSVFLINDTPSAAKFNDVTGSIIVCDGDIDVPQFGYWGGSAIIANGRVRSLNSPSSVKGCYIWATDGIEFPFMASVGENYLSSGGKVQLKVGPARPADRVREDLKADPLGMRFFKLSDVGVEVAERRDGLYVTAVKPNSRFAFYDVRPGDQVTHVNGERTDGAKEFRRRVRQSVVAEYGVFHIRRGNEATTRVVSFRDVILPR